MPQTRILLDTNVLVAALVEVHPHHDRVQPWLERVFSREAEGLVSCHGLAESYSVLTNLPLVPRIRPEQAQAMLSDSANWLQPVRLDALDYLTAIARVAQLGLSGGGIYDALHAQAALKVGADTLLTLNPRHFTRLGDDVAALVRTPSY